MANSFFRFKQFTIHQDRSAMKVTTDGCLFGAWTANAIHQLQRPPVSCLDIGTGTGLLSLMVKQQNPDCIIDAVEIDEAAAREARYNIEAAGKSEQITVHQEDILQFQPGKKYSVIFSNPPFYENELKGTDPGKNKAHHNEGLLFNELLIRCHQLLESDGHVYLLLPFKREKELMEKINDAGFLITRHTRVRPAVQLGYFRFMIEIKFNSDSISSMSSEELSVKDEQDRYTPSFTGLLRDYYLYL